jgi:gliding motility-associated-like protein
MGGGNEDAPGGVGGCSNGSAGTSPFGPGGGGATQLLGGNGGPSWLGLGQVGQAGQIGNGGNGGSFSCFNNAPGGGGGGGLNGGGGGGTDCWNLFSWGGGGGGGGSSLVPTGGACTQGNNNGQGYLSITYVAGTGTATATNTGAYCAGATIQLNASGSGTYSWSGPNGFTSTLQNPTIPNSTTANAGVYTLTVSALGCTATATTTVVVNAVPNVEAGQNQAICQGNQVILTATGATTYSWNNAIANGVPFTQAVGTVSYTVTGTVGSCSATDQVSVTVNALPTVNAGQDVAICNLSSVTLAAATSFTQSFTWDNGVADGVPFTPTNTTTYTLTGTSPAGCLANDQVTVTINALPTVSAGSNQTVCLGTDVTLNGNGAMSYTWDNGIFNGLAFTPYATATYTVTGTDGNNCTNTAQVLVTVNPLPSVNAGMDKAICEETSVTLAGSGATNYTWDNGVTDGIAFLPAVTATYTVTGTDGNGCVDSDEVLVTVNTLPSVNAGLDQSVCAETSILLNGSGAVTYAWDNGVTDGQAFTPTTTTTYNVIGTDGNGCEDSDEVLVTVYALPPVYAGVDQTVCSETTLTLSGSGALTYEWDNAVIDAIGFIPAATATYTVTGTDANNCINSDQVNVTVNALPPVSAGADQSICAGTSVILNASGAVSYGWDNGVTDGVAFLPIVTTTYTVTGTDANNCINTDQMLVVINPLPLVDAGLDQIVCDGTSVTLNVTGSATYSWDNGVTNNVPFYPGVGELIYTVTGVSGANCVNTDQVTVTVNSLPVVDAGTVQNICVGSAVTLSGSGALNYSWDSGVIDGQAFNPTITATYSVSGTDVNGCINSDQVVVNVNSLPTVSAGTLQNICSGGAVILSGSGAVSYTWDNSVIDGQVFNPTSSATYTVSGTDANGCVNTDQVIVNVNSLPIVIAGTVQDVCVGGTVILSGSGAISYTWDNSVLDGQAFSPANTSTYTVTGTDANGCENTDQVIVNVNALPTVNAGSDKVICEGTNVTLTATGATSYTWTPLITNGTAFTPPIGSTTYTVTGTDANGCENSDQVTVSTNTLPTIYAGTDQTICFGDAVTLTATGGSIYNWSNSVLDDIQFIPLATTTYTVTGTDANGCINTDQVLVTVNPLPLVNGGLDVTVCDGNSVTLSGNGAATYSWDNGILNGVPFTPVSSGTYSVTGTSANGCESIDQLTLTVSPTPEVSFVANVTEGCVPLDVTFVNTGNTGVECNWTISNGTTLSGCGPVGTVFNSGGCNDVTLTVTSNDGCIGTQTIANMICVEDLPVASFTATPFNYSINNSEVSFQNSSTGAISYVWTFGQNLGTSNQIDPTFDFSDESSNQEVELIAFTPLGCTDTAYAIVEYLDDIILYIPNSFTPDGDMFNQTFEPVFTSGFDPYNFSMFIFNRWGELIFETHNAEIGWDGTYGGQYVQVGTYSWKIEFKPKNTDDKLVRYGHVTIVR